MLDRLLGLDDTAGVGRLEWYLRQRWLVGAALLILASIVLAAFLYRRERGVSKGRRVLLALCARSSTSSSSSCSSSPSSASSRP